MYIQHAMYIISLVFLAQSPLDSDSVLRACVFLFFQIHRVISYISLVVFWFWFTLLGSSTITSPWSSCSKYLCWDNKIVAHKHISTEFNISNNNNLHFNDKKIWTSSSLATNKNHVYHFNSIFVYKNNTCFKQLELFFANHNNNIWNSTFKIVVTSYLHHGNHHHHHNCCYRLVKFSSRLMHHMTITHL